MNIIDHVGDLAIPSSTRSLDDITLIVMHDGETTSAQQTVDVLKQRGLGYHFIIEHNGDIWEMAPVNHLMWHALHWNGPSIGICYVGGLKKGDINQAQINASIELIEELKLKCPKLAKLVGHRHVTTEGKVDPVGVDCQSLAILCGLLGPKTP